MFTTTIHWTVYDGTAKTRPHNLRKPYYELPDKQRAKFEASYMLKRHGASRIEDQAFSLQVRERRNEKKDSYVFDCWFWQSAWLNSYEDNETYPLQVGDMWAPYPGIESIEGQPGEQTGTQRNRVDS